MIGNLKALRREMHKGNDRFELYNLSTDPREMHDLAAENPELIERVRAIVEKEHRSSSNPRWRFSLIDN
jgi:arylsulfatase